MKELSIEEKAKAYDNVREKIATRFGSNVAKEIFSEYEESEDERIRREIIDLICRVYNNTTYITCKEYERMLAWLEKQGKQKNTFSQPTEGEFPYNNPSNTLDGEIDNIWKKLSCGNEFCSNKNGFHEVIVHFANWIKNQSNKKWHYSNEKCMDNDALVLFHSTFDNTWNLKNSSIINWNVVGKWALLSDILPAEEYNITGVGSKHAQGKLGEMIMNLKPVNEVLEQNPAELNDDDKQYLLVCKNALYKYQMSDKWDANIIYQWLESKVKSSVQQPKQEWSEEDNQYLCGLIGLVEQSKAELPITLKGKAADNCIDWLKSLRPQSQWKPSDRQMKALKEACDEHWEPDGLDPLYTLWEQLKKLRGE